MGCGYSRSQRGDHNVVIVVESGREVGLLHIPGLDKVAREALGTLLGQCPNGVQMQLLGMILCVGRVEYDVVLSVPVEDAVHHILALGQGLQCLWLGTGHRGAQELDVLIVVVRQDEGQTGSIAVTERSGIEINPTGLRFGTINLRSKKDIILINLDYYLQYFNIVLFTLSVIILFYII